MELTVLKIFLAGITGIIIGLLNRSWNSLEQLAVLGVFALIGMGSALITTVSLEFFKPSAYPWTGDPGRIAAQVISALGFIGTGLIWKSEKDNKVKGISVAASIWVTSILGLLIGTGLVLPTLGGVLAVGIIYWINSIIDWERVEQLKKKFKKSN